MHRDAMVISEEWRWRFLAIWVLLFTLISAYSLFRVHAFTDDNRDALCAIHETHVVTDRSLKVLMEKGGMDVREITIELEREESALSELGCPEP